MVSILVVDDNVGVRSSLRDWVIRHVGNAEVIEAGTGEEAIALVAAATPALVLMDIRLPGMNGLDATCALRSQHPSLPVIIVTLHDAQEFKNDARVAGASGFVQKLHAARDLPALLEALLPSAVSAVPRTMALGGL